MALALKFDKKRSALAGARFRAWWNGADFNEESALAEIEAKLAADAEKQAAKKAEKQSKKGAEPEDLFEAEPYEPSGRLRALSLLWGAGRVRPGDAGAEAQAASRLGAPDDGVVVVLGPGLEQPLAAMAGAAGWKFEVFEWREETFAGLRHGVRTQNLSARVSLTRIDLESHALRAAHCDGLISLDDFGYCSYPPHLAQQIYKTLKPGACAIVEAYVGERTPAYATAFASSFAEPHIRPAADLLKVFADTGFVLEADEDLTEEFLALARAGFKQLGERLAAAGDLDVTTARELAWEAEAWRARMSLLSMARLQRRRFVLRKPAAEDDPQAGKANAPQD